MATFPDIAHIQSLLADHGLADASVILQEIALPAAALQDKCRSVNPAERALHGPSGGGLPPPLVIRGDADIYPASMIKCALALAAADARARGVIPAAGFVVRPEHVTPNDAPSPLISGYRSDYRELLSLMLRGSDNIATNVLLDAVGRDAATAIVQRYGLTKTKLRRYLSGSEPRLTDPAADGENEHAPVDAARFFELLAGAELPDSELMCAALLGQIWNEKLAAGLQPGDQFWHKTGDTSQVSHDGGILLTVEGRAYVIVLYTQRPSNEATAACMAAWMQRLRRLI